MCLKTLICLKTNDSTGIGGVSLYDEKDSIMKNAKEDMLLQLEQMSRSGVGLFVDGQRVLPAEAVSRAVREDSPYMADYVLGDSGAVEQVRFDKVIYR